MCLSARPSKPSMLMPMAGSLLYNPSVEQSSSFNNSAETGAVLSAIKDRLRKEQRRTRERLSRLHERKSERETSTCSVTDTAVSSLQKQVASLKNLLQAKSYQCQRLEAQVLEFQRTEPSLKRHQEQNECTSVLNQVVPTKYERVILEPSHCDGVVPVKLGHTTSPPWLPDINAHSCGSYQSIVFSAPESVIYQPSANRNSIVLGSAEFSDFSLRVAMATPRNINRFVNLSVPRMLSSLHRTAMQPPLIKRPIDLVSSSLSARVLDSEKHKQKHNCSVSKNSERLQNPIHALQHRLLVLGRGCPIGVFEKVHLLKIAE